MTTPHKHADLIKSWADGEFVQVWSSTGGGWVDDPSPQWLNTSVYRVRPKPLEGYFCLFPDGRVEGPVEEDVLLGPGSRLIYLREGEPPTKV